MFTCVKILIYYIRVLVLKCAVKTCGTDLEDFSQIFNSRINTLFTPLKTVYLKLSHYDVINCIVTYPWSFLIDNNAHSDLPRKRAVCSLSKTLFYAWLLHTLRFQVGCKDGTLRLHDLRKGSC